jgi:hypothetical protein
MSRSPLARALRVGALLVLPGLAAAPTSAASAAPAAATTLAGAAQAPVAFTAAELAAYERGIAREAALVQEARARGRAARTPAERSAAAQAEWDAATIPGGAQAAGLSVARYRQVRATLHRVLSTLDFQGKIDGPQEIDPSAASPEMKRRLAADPIAELAPASAAALRARMDGVARAYIAYMTLVAVNG